MASISYLQAIATFLSIAKCLQGFIQFPISCAIFHDIHTHSQKIRWSWAIKVQLSLGKASLSYQRISSRNDSLKGKLGTCVIFGT